MTFPAELERLLKSGDLQRASILLTNHADAILGLVRAAETHVRLHGKIGCDKGIAQALKEFGEEMTIFFSSNPEPLAWDGLPKLNGEGK